jgi:subunit length determinant Wzz-like protein
MSSRRNDTQREIDALDLVALVWSRRLLLFAAAFAAGAIALVASLAAPTVWQGRIVAQVGQVGQAGQAGQAGAQLVEPIARAIERFSMKDFQDSCLRKAGLSTREGDPEAELYRSSLTGVAVGNTDLIRVTVRGFSRDAIARLLKATVDQLASTHDEIAVPTIRTLRNRLDHLTAELGLAREDLARLRRREESLNGSRDPERFIETVYLQGLIATKVGEIRAFEEQKLVLDEQLSRGRTYPTAMVDRVGFDLRPVSPHVLRNVVVASLAVLALFVVALLFREAFRTRSPAIEEAAPAESGTGAASGTRVESSYR